MKILFILLFLISCGNGKIQKGKDVNSDLQRYEDKEMGIVCYSIVWYDKGGLSCVKK